MTSEANKEDMGDRRAVRLMIEDTAILVIMGHRAIAYDDRDYPRDPNYRPRR